MKNKKYSLLVFALLLTMLTSACSSAGRDTESPASGDSKASAVVSEASKTEPSDEDPDAPVEPRITYSKDGGAGTSKDMLAAREALTYDSFTADEPVGEAYGEKSLTAAAAAPGSAGAVKNEITADAGDYPPTVSAEASFGGDDVVVIDPVEPDPYQPEPAIGLLTAGEWKDNDNWGFFTNLVNSDRISFPSYGIDPRYRIKIDVTSPDKAPLANVKVDLLDKDDNIIWSAVTDKNGAAYVFDDKEGSGYSVQVSDGTKTQKTELSADASKPVAETDPQSQQQGRASADIAFGVTFDGEDKKYEKLDLMFIVDATGSMGDEMVFLQKEFTGISEAVGDKNTRYSVNFYRDEGDEYVTKCYDFTKNVADLQKQLNSEVATGGGDTPEAVDRILEESIVKSRWSEDSVKLAFMIFDAPPHEGTEESILNSVKAAAEKGIRLIPVVSSNSERETELFGRACAIATGGTYVFLTDDSGVGGSHLEPIIGKYQVEKLYDLIIRVIDEYKQAPEIAAD